MALSIVAAVAQIKKAPTKLLGRGVIEDRARAAGHSWRERDLGPFRTVALFIQQICHGNTSIAELVRISHGTFSDTSYCKARMRLPLEVIERASDHVYQVNAVDKQEYRWRGHRTWIIDGSTASMADTLELREHFGLPGSTKKGCGFPAAHLLVLFDAGTGMFAKHVSSKLRTADLTHTLQLHEVIAPGDILLGDEHFGSWAHIALLQGQGKHALFPINHRRYVDFTPGRPHVKESESNPDHLPRSVWVKSLGWEDQLVQWPKPKTKPEWLSKEQYAALPEFITVRELRRTVKKTEGSGKVTLTMVTTLLDPEDYPAAAVTDLRLQRWQVETNLGHLKTTMKMDILRCETVQGVLKELAIYRLVYNIVRAIMLEAAERQEVAVARISFADALYWLRHARPGEELPKLKVNPKRTGRVEPRAKKRRPKVFDRLNKPREQMREALRNKARAA